MKSYTLTKCSWLFGIFLWLFVCTTAVFSQTYPTTTTFTASCPTRMEKWYGPDQLNTTVTRYFTNQTDFTYNIGFTHHLEQAYPPINVYWDMTFRSVLVLDFSQSNIPSNAIINSISVTGGTDNTWNLNMTLGKFGNGMPTTKDITGWNKFTDQANTTYLTMSYPSFTSFPSSAWERKAMKLCFRMPDKWYSTTPNKAGW
jgi:hypothetical protein